MIVFSRNGNNAVALVGVRLPDSSYACLCWSMALAAGATTCVSGSVCTELNSCMSWSSYHHKLWQRLTIYTDYYQCLPGTATTSPSSPSSPTTSSSSAAPTGTSGISSLPRLGGVNTAGYDFSVVSTPCTKDIMRFDTEPLQATNGSFTGTG